MNCEMEQKVFTCFYSTPEVQLQRGWIIHYDKFKLKGLSRSLSLLNRHHWVPTVAENRVATENPYSYNKV